MTDAAVRLATTNDLSTLVLLYDQMVAEQASARGGYVWEQTRPPHENSSTRLADAIAAENEWVLLGTYSGVAVGFAALKLQPLRDGDVMGVVQDLFVDPQAREVGVGEVLMNRIIELCRSHNCIGVDAMVLPGNRSAKNFMESHGLKARLIQVHKDLR
ncbi:MAG: N-acetyltransferase family protein [Acidimicrobiales bacterium]